MRAPRLFLSFASEDAGWKRNFTNREWFGDQLGPVEVVDYKMGDNLPFGPLREWLEDQVSTSAAFVAFVSRNYIDKKYPLAEWSLGLSQAAQQKLVFVPVLMDGTAKAWWAELKRQGRLRDLGDDYNYSDFTDGSGKPFEIVTDVGPVDRVIRRIGELARLIREHLQQVDSSPARDASLVPAPGGRRALVVLGHPTAITNPAVGSSANALAEELTRAGLAPMRWDDGWRNTSGACRGSDSLAQGGALFVQPLGPGEAEDLAETPQRLRSWLERSVKPDAQDGIPALPDSRFAIWLPEGLSDARFLARAAERGAAEGDPALRTDNPHALAAWLRDCARGTSLPEVPVLTLEEVDHDDGGRLREALHVGFHAVVGEVVRPPPERWTFSAETLVDTIKQLHTDRAIVTIHDLNTKTARDYHEARRQLEQKLGSISSDVNRAIRDTGRNRLRLFWSALLVQKAEQLPWVKYPSPSQFENWCLLPFVPGTPGDNKGPVVRPKPGPVNVFRTYLRDWVHSAPA